MTKLIAAFIIIVVLFGGYHLFLYWERVKNEEETQKKQAVAAAVQGENLPGLPPGLEPSLKAAQQKSPAAFRKWLKTYDKALRTRARRGSNWTPAWPSRAKTPPRPGASLPKSRNARRA